MEEQHKNEIYLQKSESERLQVEKDMGGLLVPGQRSMTERSERKLIAGLCS